MIQAIRKKPKTTPFAPAAAMSGAGMPKTAAARTTAITIPHRAETQTRLRSTSSTKKSVRTGSADTSVESGHHPSGS